MPENKRSVYEAVFKKSGMMVFISHLDLMRLFRRAIRRAGLPFVLTEGYTPRVRISMPSALKLGKESSSENIKIWLVEITAPERIEAAINDQLPEGVRINKVIALK